MWWWWLGPLIGVAYLGMIIVSGFIFVHTSRSALSADYTWEEEVIGACFWPIVLPIVLAYCGVRKYADVLQRHYKKIHQIR